MNKLENRKLLVCYWICLIRHSKKNEVKKELDSLLTGMENNFFLFPPLKYKIGKF